MDILGFLWIGPLGPKDHDKLQLRIHSLIPSKFLIHLAHDFFFFLFRAISVAYGNSQARGRIGAAAASLYHNHSKAGSLTY